MSTKPWLLISLDTLRWARTSISGGSLGYLGLQGNARSLHHGGQPCRCGQSAPRAGDSSAAGGTAMQRLYGDMQ